MWFLMRRAWLASARFERVEMAFAAFAVACLAGGFAALAWELLT